jgi:carboxyl-terminal processing protease
MKKITGILILCIVALLMCSSRINATPTNHKDQQQVNNLATLAKVWGFLKYYHPDAARGNPDWDKELVRMIPLVKAAGSKEAFNKLIADWYASLPKAPLSSSVTQIKNDTIVRTFDEKDIAAFGVSRSLTEEFTRLYLYHLPDSSRYITDHYKQYKLDYISHREDPYTSPAFPDEEHRLLSLFRYWNIIEFFYPYKKINTGNWKKVLPDFIPQFIKCDDSTGYRKTFLLLTTQLKDSHSFFSNGNWDKTHYRLLLPFELTYIDGHFYIGSTGYDSLTHALDFAIGDEIVGLNDETIGQRVNAFRSMTTGTNELSFYRNVGYYLFRLDTNRIIRITIKRQGQVINKTVRLFTRKELSAFHKSVQPLWKDMGNGVYYVRFCDIPKVDTLKQLFADLQHAKTVIWDMRGYPSFPVVQALARGVYEKKFPSTIIYNSILSFPGSMTKKIEGTAYTAADTIALQLYSGKMIVLVNEQTQSLSESVAYELSLRPNTIVMGSQTAGTTGNITWVQYPGDISASFTGVGVEGLKGSFTEGKGVKIDKEVKLTLKGLVDYKDYLLEMAYREAMGNKQ